MSYVCTINQVMHIPLLHIKDYKYLNRVINQIDRKRTFVHFSNFLKSESAFVLTLERTLILFLKTVLVIFKLTLRLRDWHVFTVQSLEISNNCTSPSRFPIPSTTENRGTIPSRYYIWYCPIPCNYLYMQIKFIYCQ